MNRCVQLGADCLDVCHGLERDCVATRSVAHQILAHLAHDAAIEMNGDGRVIPPRISLRVPNVKEKYAGGVLKKHGIPTSVRTVHSIHRRRETGDVVVEKTGGEVHLIRSSISRERVHRANHVRRVARRDAAGSVEEAAQISVTEIQKRIPIPTLETLSVRGEEEHGGEVFVV
jgi:hypothetical protein